MLNSYCLYADGKSPRRIAFDLNTRDTFPLRGVGLGPSTLNGNRSRGTRILNNEMYIGRLVWNRPELRQGPGDGQATLAQKCERRRHCC